jgi:predicted nuclease with TOPRIM domain
MPSTIQKRYNNKKPNIKSTSVKKRRRASMVSQSCRIIKRKPNGFEDLMSQLDYSYDALATINVIFDSLRHTYTNCKSKIEQQMTDARLCDMEKELLIAYDDLNSQIVNLEKDISLMEEKMIQLKSNDSTVSSNSSTPSMLSMLLFDAQTIEV